MDATFTFLTRYEAEGEELLPCIIMGDESWIHHQEAVQPKVWKSKGERAQKKSKGEQSAGMVQLTVFWDSGCYIQRVHVEVDKNDCNYSTVVKVHLHERPSGSDSSRQCTSHSFEHESCELASQSRTEATSNYV